MPPVRRANKATADDLAASIPPTRTIHGKTFSFTVQLTSDMYNEERDAIWQLFEDNMHQLYRASSFGWNPPDKQKELFHAESRFVVVRDAGLGIIAYTMFRFEREDRQDVVYCYELQVSKHTRRFGIGRVLVQMLSDMGARWEMTKVMLTVFKANHTALLFYTSIGFTTDETSPDYAGDWEGGGYDYTILSRLGLAEQVRISPLRLMPPSLRTLAASRCTLGRRYASHGAPHYNEPTGWLFGEKPLPPGQKRVKEDWENIWYIGMFGSMALATVLLYYKPDTSIQTWALKEAKQRMEARGEKYKYESSS